VFTDSYWDIGDCDLMRKDMWLRQRSGLWELKLPITPFTSPASTTSSSGSSGGSTVYRELTTVRDVVAALRSASPLLADVQADSGAALTVALQHAGGSPFAKFSTRRRKFRSVKHLTVSHSGYTASLRTVNRAPPRVTGGAAVVYPNDRSKSLYQCSGTARALTLNIYNLLLSI
jgi:hypothetical protein